jgi:hypothetical protein
MPAAEHRNPAYEVAEYDYAQQRITVKATYDYALPALEGLAQLLRSNQVPDASITAVRDSLHTSLLRGVTLFEHECLATNRRVSFIVRK